MILLSRIRYLIYIIARSVKFRGVLLKAVTTKLKKAIIKNNSIAIWLTSESRIPNLAFGSRPFIAIRVSLPHWITIPQIDPVANTVFYHITFSSDRDSF